MLGGLTNTVSESTSKNIINNKEFLNALYLCLKLNSMSNKGK